MINRRIIGGYVQKWEQFIFLDGIFGAFRILAELFGRIIVVSNQQGIGKGLMDAGQVEIIHNLMVEKIEEEGGRIDGVYFSPHLEQEGHPDRKPGIGMALKARRDFPGIEFGKSLMVGDSLADIEFGKKAGMYTAFLGPLSAKEKETAAADFYFKDLLSFAEALISTNLPGH